MQPLQIELSRRADGSAVMRCVRADGSVSWQRHDGRYASFFPFHDLTHLAVESVLGFEEGFFGLIAAGWEISETTGKTERGPLPAEALLVEQLAGLLDRERVGGSLGESAPEFNAMLEQVCRASGLSVPYSISDADLEAIRSKRDFLHSRWGALPPGGSLELSFPDR